MRFSETSNNSTMRYVVSIDLIGRPRKIASTLLLLLLLLSKLQINFRCVIYLIAVISQTAAELVITSHNTEARVGDVTYLNCSTNMEDRAIFWYHGDKYVYTTAGILDPYRLRFEIDWNAPNKSFNLIIHSVEPDDAGKYICVDDDGLGARHSAELVVLENDPTCQSNIQPDGVIGQNVFNIPPDEVQLTCNVTYYGNIHPQLQWKKAGDTSSAIDGVESHVRSNNRFTYMYTLKLKGDISLDNSSYICKTSKAIQNQYKCNTETINVLYMFGGYREELQVFIGDKITCVAHNSTMSCSSQWYHDNYTCPLSCDETITTHLLGIYLCTMKCNVRGTDYFHETLKVSVVEATTPPPWLTSDIIVIAAVVLIVIMAVLIVVLVVLYKRKVLAEKRLSQEAHMISEQHRLLAEGAKGSRTIWGLTILHQELFILRYKNHDIEVYDSTEFKFRRKMTVNGMANPGNILPCSRNNCLYTTDSEFQGMFHAILRIDPIKGVLIKCWPIHGRRSELSVASDTNVILCPGNEANLYEYTADGELIRTIHLGRDTDGRAIEAAHAVKLDSGLFVICKIYPGRVYLLSTKDTYCTFARIDEVEIRKKFDKKSDLGLNGEIRSPHQLSLDKEESILVSEGFSNRAVLLSRNFDKARILVSGEDGMISVRRSCFDESTGKWVVTDGSRISVCRVEDEIVERQIYDLIKQEENLDELICNTSL